MADGALKAADVLEISGRVPKTVVERALLTLLDPNGNLN